ncbi:NnrS family protein [Thalassotalea nanhaiensis]|uniref:NnrS family protein n=1 Tax=Thalassotalea nanhaiensis TaxID=3065648 RepID=A0ABY9TEP1_9GAMM|nr:NnrS family protein [Colwelliaceae bacterium SQ345]
MINIANTKTSSTEQKNTPMAFLELAFRPFFLCASFFSIISLLLWGAMLNGSFTADVYGGALWWHKHEMLFGFVSAIIVGFLLTAVQNWTGVRSLNGKGLLGLFILWLLGRVLFLMPVNLSPWFIILVDITFLPLAAAALAYPIIQVKLWRNLMFIPILLIMTLINIVMHYSIVSQSPQLMNNASTAMVLLVTLIMTIMGGRVFPMFTANGTQTPRVNAVGWLEKVVIITTLVALIISFNIIDLPTEFKAGIYFIAAVAHAARAFRWKVWVTLKTPLVWSLHFSYWCIAIGLLLFGVAELSATVSQSQAVHLLTVGAMGTMILSMISRVSLGHTGRAIVASKLMTFAFITIILSTIFRVFGSYFLTDYSQVINTAIVFWVIAYGCFVYIYLPILTKAKPGY